MKDNGTPVPGNMAPWLGLRSLGGEPLRLCRYINGFLRGANPLVYGGLWNNVCFSYAQQKLTRKSIV